MRLLNTGIMARPLNWAIVFAVTLFWLVLIALVFPEGSDGPNSDQG